jgi:hypothetical protein
VVSRKVETLGGCLIVGGALTAIVASIGVTVALYYAAFHFIVKFW